RFFSVATNAPVSGCMQPSVHSEKRTRRIPSLPSMFRMGLSGTSTSGSIPCSLPSYAGILRTLNQSRIEQGGLRPGMHVEDLDMAAFPDIEVPRSWREGRPARIFIGGRDQSVADRKSVV